MKQEFQPRITRMNADSENLISENLRNRRLKNLPVRLGPSLPSLPSVRILLLLSIAIFCVSCSSTIAPKENRAAETAFVGNEQTAGVLGFADGGGVAISGAKRDEWNALIDTWGTDSRLGVTLKRDAGITPCTGWTDKKGVHHTGVAWSLDKEHVTKFSKMKSWQRRGDKPPGAISKLMRKISDVRRLRPATASQGGRGSGPHCRFARVSPIGREFRHSSFVIRHFEEVHS